ncbi:MAG: hypothetical protein WBI41_08500, partial [Azovibrio sp.]
MKINLTLSPCKCETLFQLSVHHPWRDARLRAASLLMLSKGEHRTAVALQCGVSAPHLVGAIRLDQSVVQDRFALGATMGRQQAVLAHQAQRTSTGDADATQDPKPRPDLAVTFANKGRGFQVGTDCGQKIGVRKVRFRTTPLRVQGHPVGRFPRLLRIDRRAGKFEHPAD